MLDRQQIGQVLVVVTTLAVLSGCATTARRRAEVEHGRYWPRGSSWSRAAKTAINDPNTWVPAAGAAVVWAADWDEGISEWAVENTPLFGSPDNARDWSDDLRTLCDLSMISTALAAPNQPGPWGSRWGRLGIEQVGVITSTSVSGLMQDAIGRERPDGSDETSFPSSHATRAFAYVANTRRNLDLIPMSNSWRRGLKGGFTALAAGTAWARVEGGKHHPSDVLFGAALGNFVAILIHDAFIGREPRVRIETTFRRDGGDLSVTVRY